MLFLISLFLHTTAAFAMAPTTVGPITDSGVVRSLDSRSADSVLPSIIAPLKLPLQPTAKAPLVFDGVTVIDVEHGRRILNQRVVIVGNRIKKIDKSSAVSVPSGAHVVDAHGKYLIPGLWDMHIHPAYETELIYPMLIANGVTGIRDAGSPVPLDTLILWRREILAGTRVGPPRQILSGQSIRGPDTTCNRAHEHDTQTCVSDSADARRYVDSLKAAGADMIKPRSVSRAIYFAVAREAKRVGIPFGGHAEGSQTNGLNVTPIEASDSGASIVDHLGWVTMKHPSDGQDGDMTQDDFVQDDTLYRSCWGSQASASIARCQLIADRFKRNGTWFVPTMTVAYFMQAIWFPVQFREFESPAYKAIITRLITEDTEFVSGSLPRGNWLHDSSGTASTTSAPHPSSLGNMRIMGRTGLPILAGTDATHAYNSEMLPGFSLLAELSMYGAEGMPPVEVLRTATLNPAKLLHATDSMGTVSVGKLADLVLLDADPLTDITNITTTHGVIANGRYFDRAALDELLRKVQSEVRSEAK